MSVFPLPLESAKQEVKKLLLQTDDLAGGAWCHHPKYAIRMHAKKQVIFSSSLCWECNNYFLRYPDDGEHSASWVGFIGAAELKGLLEKAAGGVDKK